VLSKCAKQTNQARVWSILQPKAWLWCCGRVRCGWCYAGAVPVRVLSLQDKVVKLGAGLSKQAKAWYPVRVSCMVLSKDRVGQGLGALCGSILQPRAWLWCCGRVQCGFILHPSFSLVLGLVQRERIKSKE